MKTLGKAVYFSLFASMRSAMQATRRGACLGPLFVRWKRVDFPSKQNYLQRYVIAGDFFLLHRNIRRIFLAREPKGLSVHSCYFDELTLAQNIAQARTTGLSVARMYIIRLCVLRTICGCVWTGTLHLRS